MIYRLLSTLLLLATAAGVQATPRSAEYEAVQKRLQTGWGVWNNADVLSQVLLPYGLEIRMGVKKESTLDQDGFLAAAITGRRGKDEEEVFPASKTFDGRYSRLRVTWRGIAFQLETARVGDDVLMLATPLSRDSKILAAPTAIFSANMLWNRPGSVERAADHIVAKLPGRTIAIYPAGATRAAPQTPITGPFFSLSLDRPAGISTGSARTIAQISAIVADARRSVEARTKASGPAGETRAAIETVMAWNAIYDPENNRIITPVSRQWSQRWGGYVLFEWDTFFAASLASVGSRDLAYANALEILNEMTPGGMIPNYARSEGNRSTDRSQPPVGSITVLQLYDKFHDRWLLRDTFDRLMRWNGWWLQNRVVDGYLAWGSNAKAPPINRDDPSPGSLQAARYESGLDNSPMYDEPVGFDSAGERMQLADVGLMSLFIADCRALSKIAQILGRLEDAATLDGRAAMIGAKLKTMWDPASGMFLNRNLITGLANTHMSPTNFYPLLAGVATPAQVKIMVERHLLNPDEFGGTFILPSIARSDPTFKDQFYWRGRIWAPMVYLTWLGTNAYQTAPARKARDVIARNAWEIFIREWRTHSHVHENYSAIGYDHEVVIGSDNFYHWGALMALIGPSVEPRLWR